MPKLVKTLPARSPRTLYGFPALFTDVNWLIVTLLELYVEEMMHQIKVWQRSLNESLSGVEIPAFSLNQIQDKSIKMQKNWFFRCLKAAGLQYRKFSSLSEPLCLCGCVCVVKEFQRWLSLARKCWRIVWKLWLVVQMVCIHRSRQLYIHKHKTKPCTNILHAPICIYKSLTSYSCQKN